MHEIKNCDYLLASTSAVLQRLVALTRISGRLIR